MVLKRCSSLNLLSVNLKKKIKAIRKKLLAKKCKSNVCCETNQAEKKRLKVLMTYDMDGCLT